MPPIDADKLAKAMEGDIATFKATQDAYYRIVEERLQKTREDRFFAIVLAASLVGNIMQFFM